MTKRRVVVKLACVCQRTHYHRRCITMASLRYRSTQPHRVAGAEQMYRCIYAHNIPTL